MPRLGGRLGGLALTMLDLSWITGELSVGGQPQRSDYDTLRQMGVGLLVNLRWERRPPRDDGQPPLRLLWLPSFDFPLAFTPLPLLRRGVNEALATIGDGQRVFVHCAHGVHRSVALAAAVLIAQGMSAEAAMGHIRQRRPAAEPQAWYVKRRILQFERDWQKGNNLAD
jgi:protein tyrosine phosphatase (PTP) superfamily phosphohydrolase (DUF442 family)